MEKISSFLEQLKNYQSSCIFNPYLEVCSIYDNKNSPIYRADLLEKMLNKAHSNTVEAIWLGRDLGHRGGRRTGFALTDDLNLENHLKRWQLESNYQKIENPMKEQTATVIWESLNQIDANIFLWNLFPYHPFDETQSSTPFNNRCHNQAEGEFGIVLLKNLVDIIQPNYVLAIGNDAYYGANNHLDIEVKKVRHPSHGGQNLFKEQISDIYGL